MVKKGQRMREEFARDNRREINGCDGQSSINLLKSLTREEILEVLSGGFCRHCEASLENRIRNLFDNDNKMHISNDSSRDYDSPRPQMYHSSPFHTLTNSELNSFQHPGSEIIIHDSFVGISSSADFELSEEEEITRYAQVGGKNDFFYNEWMNGKQINVLQGIELYTRVFNIKEQSNIIEFVYYLQKMGQKGQLRERTYSEPRKWMRGKGRVTIQFGCCYNYAKDKNGNPPGIMRDEEVDPLPPLFKQMIKRMVKWNIFPSKCIPDSCIVNIYDEGDCIPPHIDHHDFERPFCTVSLMTECNIVFGLNLKIIGPGEFKGPVSVRLPLGSVLVLNGNGADVASHCIPSVPAKRISITFRKMDDRKLPYAFRPDPELQDIRPLRYPPKKKSNSLQNQNRSSEIMSHDYETVKKRNRSSEIMSHDYETVKKRRRRRSSEVMSHDYETVKKRRRRRSSEVMSYDYETVKKRRRRRSSEVMSHDYETITERRRRFKY